MNVFGRLILFLIVVARVQACVCSGNWPSVKQAWQQAAAVFLGTVEVADPDGSDRQMMFQEQFVRIRVDEAFKGIVTGDAIDMHEDANDCAAKFHRGQRAVFYLDREAPEGSWFVPACTHSMGTADPLGDDLLFLRGLPKSAKGTRLSGTLELYEESPTQAFRRVGGLANVPVTISGPAGSERRLRTTADGAYEVYGLPPGTWSVSIQVPKGLRVKFPVTTGSVRVPGNEAAIQLAADGGATVDFVLKADTRLSGRVLDANGEPKADVCVNLEPLEGRGQDGAYFFDCSKKGGAFEMEMMPAGKYWLIAEDQVSVGAHKSESTLYYPGVRDRQHASTISIEAGKYVKDLDIRIPADEQRHRIAGKFLFLDGAPVATALVRFSSPQQGYSETTSSGPDGSFVMAILAGMDGELSGQFAIPEPLLKSCPEFSVSLPRRGMFRILDSRPIHLVADSDQEDLRLELPSPSCKGLRH